VYEPVPPETEEMKVVDWPALMELGDAEQETFKVGVGLATTTGQFVVAVSPPEKTLKLALYVPALGNA